MALNGNEFLQVTGLDNLGRPSGETEVVTTQQIASLGSGAGVPQIISGAAGTLVLTAMSTSLFVDTSSAPASFTLPAGSIQGRQVTMIDFNNNAGTNSITQNGTVNGNSSPNVFKSNSVIVTFYDNGTSWNM